MKSILFAIAATTALFAGTPAVAAEVKEVMTCTVPAKDAPVQVTANIVVQSESAADFVIINVNDKGQTFRLFTQTDKNEVSQDIQKGSLGYLLLEESFQQDAGVIRNAGFIVISKRESGNFEGLMSAKGNIYPLACLLK